MNLSTPNKIVFLKALIAAAWADGELTHEEMNRLKHFFAHFDLKGEDWTAVEMYLEDALSPEEQQKVIGEFMRTLGSGKEKQIFLSDLEGLLALDKNVTSEERELIDHVRGLVQKEPSRWKAGFAALFSGGNRRELSGIDRDRELEDYVKNRVLYALRRRLEKSGEDLKIEAERLYTLTLMGGLLAVSAFGDQEISDTETVKIKEVLARHGEIQPGEAQLIAEVARERVARGIERSYLTHGIRRRLDRSGRLEFIKLLFEVIDADGDPGDKELEVVRRIAYALNLSHKDFIDAKVAARPSG